MNRGSKKKRKRGKKQCELGNKCPYQHEHQHCSEYAHDIDSNEQEKAKLLKKRKKAAGRGRKLGTAKRKKVGGVGVVNLRTLAANAAESRNQVDPKSAKLKPNRSKRRSSVTSKQCKTTNENKSAQNSKWVCRRCTFLNTVNTKTCTICEAMRFREQDVIDLS